MLKKLKAYYVFLIGFFYLFVFDLSAQDQRVADSLGTVYKNEVLSNAEKLVILKELAYNETNDLNLALSYAESLLKLAKEENKFYYEYHGHLQKGSALLMSGQLQESLNSFFEAAKVATSNHYLVGEGTAYITIADTYSEIGNSNNAENYYLKGIEILRKTDDSVSLATGLLNAGDEYFNNRKFEQALKNYEESGQIFEEQNFLTGKAYNLGNIGMVNAEMGNHELARQNIDQALQMLEELQDNYAISEYLIYMADIYIEQNDIETALSYAQRSLDLSERFDLKKQIAETNLKLSEIYELKGDIQSSLGHYKDHIIYRDSVTNLEAIEEMADLRTNYEVSQKQVEVDLLNEQKRNQKIIVIATIIALFLIALLALGLYSRNLYIKKTNQIIKNERDRSDHLLLNILPEETASELKSKGKVGARRFESVSILFSDFKGFTQYAEKLSPEDLVATVDYYFSKFDEIIQKHGLEKIKTIGDAYMCVAGIHGKKDRHAERLLLAAMDMIKCVDEAKMDIVQNQTQFDIRIGINTGPVVAGVVGTRKFAYDIWGDSVNVASRMESNSSPGKINISESTYQLVKENFECEYRGELEVKNRGFMKMYFVKGLKEKSLLKQLETPTLTALSS